jgi:hypothetical protein
MKPAVHTATEIRAQLIAAIIAGAAHSKPFRFWKLRDVLPAGTAVALETLPVVVPEGLSFVGTREANNDTRYYFNAEAQATHPDASAVAEAFQHPATVAAIESATGANLAGTNLRIEYSRDTDGFWLKPHTDLGVKYYTMLLYLSQGTDVEQWGTSLYFGPPDHRIAATVPGFFNSAIVFVPSDDTWHGFEARRLTAVRKTLIINYVGPAWRARHELCFPTTVVRE